MRTLGFALLAVLAIAACSHDSTTAPSSGNTANGFSIVADSASIGQSALIGTALTMSVHVTKDSQPAPGILVTWSVTDGHGSVSPATSTTDANGVATTQWTMGDTASANNTLSASISGAAVSIAATSFGGPATSMTKVSTDSQTVVAGAAVPITIRALDKFTNPVPNVTVNWSATGGTLSAPTSATGFSGNATTNFVSPMTPGTYNITATIPGVGNIVYTVVAQ